MISLKVDIINLVMVLDPKGSLRDGKLNQCLLERFKLFLKAESDAPSLVVTVLRTVG